MSTFGLGATEIALLLTFLSGFGLPLGVPPAAENPSMAHVAPDDCLLYASWSAMAKPDAESENQTEQLLAEPEVQQFAKSLEKAITELARRSTAGRKDPRAEQLAKFLPVWAKAMITRSGAVFVDHLEMSREGVDLRGGVLLEAGDQAGPLVEMLVKILSSDQQKAETITIGKVKFYRFAAQKGSPLGQLTLGSVALESGKAVLVGVGEGSAEAMLKRIGAKETPQWLTDAKERLEIGDRLATVSYMNVPKIRETLLPLAPPEAAKLIESLGLNQVGVIISGSGLDETGMVSRMVVAVAGEPKGLLSLIKGNGLTLEKMAHLPSDATIVTAFSFDAEQLYRVAEDVFVENAPNGKEQWDAGQGQFEEAFGFRLQQDVLGSLGDTWALSMSPAEGWLGVTATVEVKDRKTLRAVLQRAVQLFSQQAGMGPRKPRLETTKLNGSEMQTLVIPDLPVRPSWCITDTHIVIGITPQGVKSVVGLGDDERGFEGTEIADLLEGDDGVLSIAYQDTPKLFEGSYSYLSLMLPMLNDSLSREMQPGGERFGSSAPIFDTASLPSARSIHRHLQPSLSLTRRTEDGFETETYQTLPTPNVGATAPVAVALLLPAVQSAREAARRTQSMNNLKQIMLALHNYHDTYRALPAPSLIDKDGKKPGLSWRVAILPFIEAGPLYNEFHLDEPWDSEHNKALIEKMPAIYRSPNSTAEPGKTTYLGIASKGGVFEPTKEGAKSGIGFAAIADGTSNTIAVVEVNDANAVLWTKPDDYVPDAKDPLKGLRAGRPGGFLGAMCDGSVRFFSEQIDPKMLMFLVDKADGNVVNPDAVRP